MANFVNYKFTLDIATVLELKLLTPKFGFNNLGEFVYYRTYSRILPNGLQESWHDTIIRVVNGIFSIRKDWYIKHYLAWNEGKWQEYAHDFALYMFKMKFLPPGRGLWIMGTEQVYTRGSASLNNCGAIDTYDLAKSINWAMDMLMNGVGVGGNTAFDGTDANYIVPDKKKRKEYIIPDTREGWVESVTYLINSYKDTSSSFPEFNYSLIRSAGVPLKIFGGLASGPDPLIKLHNRITQYMDSFVAKQSSATRCVVDIMNAIGACVVAGNIRRSSELILGSIHDDEFLNLKNIEKHPERAEISWLSNNSALLYEKEDFLKISHIIPRVIKNGEPGLVNLKNIQRYGKYGKEHSGKATLCNPCSEINLESYELCNLSEVFPTNCESEDEFFKVLDYATFYASTVALLPTHRAETNEVLSRNRRIGVSISGVADWIDKIGAIELTRILREGYKKVREVNKRLAKESGVPESIKVTTVKPSGTISLLAGVSPGMHYPTYKYAIRRVRVSTNSSLCESLKNSGIPWEKDKYSDNTLCFEFPIDQGNTREANQVSAWEQFAFLAFLQRVWSDNMVSCTIYFGKHEENQLEKMLGHFIPLIKSVSLLPHTDGTVYEQMPYERITQIEYEKRKSQIKQINWSGFNSDGIESAFCTNDRCDLDVVRSQSYSSSSSMQLSEFRENKKHRINDSINDSDK